MPTVITDINEAWVELYDDKGFKDRCLKIKYPKNYKGLKTVKVEGKRGFNDKTSSARYQIPNGWQLVLFDDSNYKDSRFPLVGTGRLEENPDLGSFNDKTSSLKWERTI